MRSRRGSLRSVNTLPLNWTATSPDDSRCVKISRLPLDMSRQQIRLFFDFASSVFIPYDILKRNKHHGAAIVTFPSPAAAAMFIKDSQSHEVVHEGIHSTLAVSSAKEFKHMATSKASALPGPTTNEDEAPVDKVFVGGLTQHSTEAALVTYFQQFGEIKSVEIVTDKRSGRNKGFGFVEFTQSSSAAPILKRTHTIDGKAVSVKRYNYRSID